MYNRGFARGLSAALISDRPESKNFTSRVHRAVLLGGAATCALALGSLPVAAQNVHVLNGQTYTVVAPTTIQSLNIDPGGTVNLGANPLRIDDNGIDTTYSGTINGAINSGQVLKSGTGTVTFSNLTMNDGEMHVNGGKAVQSDGLNAFRYLTIGSDAGNASMDITGGTLQIGGALPVPSPSPSLQVGDFGGIGVVNQSGGIVNIVGSFNIGNQGGDGTYNLMGGEVHLSGGLYAIGRSTTSTRNSTGNLNISGGLLEVHDGNFIIGNRDAGGLTSATQGTVTQTGGTFRIQGNGTTGALYLSGYNDGTYNLNGGVLEVGGTGLQSNYNNPNPASVTAAFNLGGGTIRVINMDLNTSVNATLTGSSTSTIDTNGWAAAWNGVLSGTGNLRKAGSGTLTLSNVHTYTGETIIAGGTLALSAGAQIAASKGVNLTGSSARFDIASASKTIKGLSGVGGSVVNLGASLLTINGADDTPFYGDIQGTGGLTKQGSGVQTLGGKNGYTGATTVTQGTLRFATSDAIANTTSLSVSNLGTRLDLNGHGRQSVNGAVSLGAGTITSVDLTAGDNILATGGLSLGGGVLDIHGGAGGFDPNAVYVVATGSARAGNFGNYYSDLVFLTPTIGGDGTRSFLTFAKSGQSFAFVSETANQAAVGAAIDPLPLTNPLYAQIATLSVADAQAALNSLSGEFHASTKSVLVEQADHIGSAVSDRFASAFGDKAPAAPLGYADDDKLAALSAPDQGAGGLWAHGFASTLSMQDPSANASDVKANDAGILAGMDFGSDAWLVGIGGGYSKAAVASDGTASSGDVEALHALAYIGGEAGPVRVHGGGSYSWNTIDTTRGVVLPVPQTLTANYKARTAQAFGEISAEFGNFRPFAGANYINVATDGFSETGGNAALTVAAGSQSVTFTTVGLRAEAEMGTATAHGMAGWRHAFGDIAPTSAMAIQGSGFTVAGVPVAADAFVAEAGVDFAINKSVKVGVSYSGQIGADAQQHGAKGTANLRF